MRHSLSFAAAAVLLCGLVGCGSKPAPPPATKSGPSPSVKAGDLLKEYSSNALAADTKYKGKMLKVTGKFGSAQKAPLLGYAVQLLPEDAGGEDLGLSSVQCFLLEEAQAEVAKMKAGQIVSFEGICDGQTVGQVKFSKCLVAK